MATGYRRTRQSVNFWPGYVDGLAGLLMMLLFLLLFYVLGELALSTALDDSQQDSAKKSGVINQLLNELSIAENNNAQLEEQLRSQRQDFEGLLVAHREKISALSRAETNLQTLRLEHDALQKSSRALSAALEQETLRLQSLQSALVEFEETLKESQESLSLSHNQLAALIAERDTLKSTLAESKQLLGKTIAVQVDKILILEHSLEASQTLNEHQSDALETLSEEQTLLVGRLEELELLEQKRLNILAALNADILALQNLRDQIQDRLSIQNKEMTAKERDLVQSLAEIKLLNQQIRLLNKQLDEVNTILAIREEKITNQQIEIDKLGTRLNLILASEVSRLQKYRSDFFGRMREIVANRPEIKVIDDRFILQSEVLFPSSSADLTASGRKQLASIARILRALLSEAPDDLPWILRVDGHTDTRPINTPQFPSNWELSAARAIAVVRYLRDLGIPQERLAATGFADLHPIENRNDEIAHRRNRRIEMKLTQR